MFFQLEPQGGEGRGEFVLARMERKVMEAFPGESSLELSLEGSNVGGQGHRSKDSWPVVGESLGPRHEGGAEGGRGRGWQSPDHVLEAMGNLL